jgi:tRNA (guanine-N7-)-methyltransferase
MTANKPGDPLTLNRLYGRAKGKKLRLGQQGLVDTLLPRIAVPGEGEVTAERLFGHVCPLHFEIGFGGGEHMAYRADLLPDHGFIGAEPFLNGVAQALTHVDGDGGAHAPLGNVRIHHGDALDVLARVPDGALSFLYLLHPDPWPKARHAKRRMMNDGPVDLFAAKLKRSTCVMR